MARIKYYDSVAQEWAYADMAVALPPSRLPYKYKECEYIEGTGTQYIKFDYTPQAGDVWELDCQFTGDVSSGNFGINGGIYMSGGTTRRFSIGYYNGEFQTSASASAEGFGVSDNNRHKFVLDTLNSKFSVDLTDYTLSNVTISNISKCCLFARVYQEGIVNDADITAEKIYGSTIKRGTATLFMFVPCYNIFSNEIGLYDIVNDVFYTNDGTGTFTKGADV